MLTCNLLKFFMFVMFLVFMSLYFQFNSSNKSFENNVSSLKKMESSWEFY